LKIIGFIIELVYWNSLQYEFSFYALFMVVVGLCLIFPTEIFKGIGYVQKRLFN
jgi:hypothetical protein